MQTKGILLGLVLMLCILSKVFAQSDWEGTWSNYSINNHTFIFQVKIKDKYFHGIWYTNDNWHLFKVEFKGELTKKGKKVTGTYRYTDNSESGIFDLKLDEFSERAPQYKAGVKLFFEGHLGIDKINLRDWNGSKRSTDTTVKPLQEFVETFKKERPKAYTSEELIAIVHNADFLQDYRSYPKDNEVPQIKTCELHAYCKDGDFIMKGVNPYMLGDFYFFKNAGLSSCAIYVSVAENLIIGGLDRITKDEKGNEEREYHLSGRIKGAFVSKMTLKNGKAKIYFNELTTTTKLNCSLEN